MARHVNETAGHGWLAKRQDGQVWVESLEGGHSRASQVCAQESAFRSSPDKLLPRGPQQSWLMQAVEPCMPPPSATPGKRGFSLIDDTTLLYAYSHHWSQVYWTYKHNKRSEVQTKASTWNRTDQGSRQRTQQTVHICVRLTTHKAHGSAVSTQNIRVAVGRKKMLHSCFYAKYLKVWILLHVEKRGFNIQMCAFMLITWKHEIQVFRFIPLSRIFCLFSYNCPTGAQNQHPPAVSLHLFYCHTPALHPPHKNVMALNKKLILQHN